MKSPKAKMLHRSSGCDWRGGRGREDLRQAVLLMTSQPGIQMVRQFHTVFGRVVTTVAANQIVVAGAAAGGGGGVVVAATTVVACRSRRRGGVELTIRVLL